MIAGHFATALLAKQKAPTGHIVFFLLISQLPDLLWFAFHFLGIEPTTPGNPMTATLQTIAVDMTYSHDLLPVMGWTLLSALLGFAIFKSWRVAVAAGALIVVHSICDAISGHAHFLFGPESQQLALGLYKSAPYVAIAIDALFTLVVVGIVVFTDAKAGIKRGRKAYGVWAAVFIGAILMLASSATQSMSTVLGVNALDVLANAFVPLTVVTYLCMLAALAWADRHTQL